MKLFLVDRKPELLDAWRKGFAGISDVVVTDEDIFALGADAIVSPANSFGFMDGGIDHQISERMGWHIQEAVRKAIRARPLGELLVGEALVVPTGDARTPWLIAAPTMRVPMRISQSINAYLAMKAVLLAARAHREEVPINSVACCGLGTGIGKLPFAIAAAQMAQAYAEIVQGDFTPPASFGEAQKRQIRLNPDASLS
ncbi:MAG TPA: macro domain-containing protein [Lacunisphaera sp.]|nr:macro domain-containing protein [Lacunisphaera sp.]